MNLPNQLTAIRLILTFVFIATMSVSFPHRNTIALMVFAVAAFTDFLDGYLARKRNQVTSFGKLMDPLADKILMTGGFVILTAIGLIPAWIVVVILAREFMVTGLRLVASAEGVVLAAENLGKYKTILQIVTIIYLLLMLSSGEDGSFLHFLKPFFDNRFTGPDFLGQGLIFLSLVLTILSGFNYMWKNRQVFTRDC